MLTTLGGRLFKGGDYLRGAIIRGEVIIRGNTVTKF